MNSFIHRMRVWLIETGKFAPFLICFIVFLSYGECMYALSTQDYIMTDDAIILNKPVSWAIGEYFRYSNPVLVLLAILSFAVETCIWNKLAIAYLFANLAEKELFMAVELYEEYIYAIVGANMIVSALLVYKGIRLVTSR